MVSLQDGELYEKAANIVTLPLSPLLYNPALTFVAMNNKLRTMMENVYLVLPEHTNDDIEKNTSIALSVYMHFWNVLCTTARC